MKEITVAMSDDLFYALTLLSIEHKTTPGIIAVEILAINSEIRKQMEIISSEPKNGASSPYP